MATTVPEPPKIDLDRPPSQGSGNGGWRNPIPGGDLHRTRDYSPPPASTGIWVGLAAITMTFAAFTSALIVRQGGATDWRHFTLPPVLYLNTLVIIASSFTLEIARRRIAAFMGGAKTQATASGTLAVHNLVSRPAVCRRANSCLDATPVAGFRNRQQRELLLLLRADGSSCPARIRWARRAGAA